MKKYFAVSDVHSFTDRMLTALSDSGFDETNPEHIVIICGDAFDRGDHSDGMFNWMHKMAELNRLVYVRGNHEDLLEDCVFAIRKGLDIGYHHITNGTIKTIASIVGCSIYEVLDRTFEWSVFNAKIDELLNFINSKSVDYFQLGNTVFVHGWVPTTCDKYRKTIVHENWRDGDWKDARWSNGQKMFYKKLVPDDITTIVCGHWHVSWGWSVIKDMCPEWGEGAIFDALVHYDASLNSRLVALDACTAYTNKVNCVVFDEDGIIIDNKYSL